MPRCAAGATSTASTTRSSPACAAARGTRRGIPTTWCRKACCCVRRYRLTRSSRATALTARRRTSRFRCASCPTKVASGSLSRRRSTMTGSCSIQTLQCRSPATGTPSLRATRGIPAPSRSRKAGFTKSISTSHPSARRRMPTRRAWTRAWSERGRSRPRMRSAWRAMPGSSIHRSATR